MNILQQLSETKLSKEEIECIIEICDHAAKMYDENLDSLDKIISLYESTGEDAPIKLIIESDEGLETKSKTIDDVKAYRQTLIDDNETTIENLRSAAGKLRELTKIFE